MKRLLVVFISVIASMSLASNAKGQCVFLDADGDGVWTTKDRLRDGRATMLDVWLVTDRGCDNVPVRVSDAMQPLTISSYSFALRAVNGQVKWGAYTNLQATMSVVARRSESETELCLGYAGMEQLPPGKYKLGTLEVLPSEGRPFLQFVSRSTLDVSGITAFGSLQPGKDQDNTLKLAENRTRVGNNVPEEPGDWSDSRGAASTTGEYSEQLVSGPFGVEVRRTGSTGFGRAQIVVTMERSGPLSVRLYNVRGQLVRTLLQRGGVPPGEVILDVGGVGDLASGIYIYSVEAAEGKRQGKVAVLR